MQPMADIPPIFPSQKPGAAEDLRRILRLAADQVADYLSTLGDRPIFPAEAQAPTGSLLPEQGEPLETLFGDAAHWAIENAIHVGHPGYLGHMDSGVAVAGILGDFLASALNQNLLAYELAPGATLLEKKLIQLFADLAGLPQGSGGIMTTGGTGANLTALLLARDTFHRHASRRGLSGETPACILASADAHYSLAKAAAVLGMGSERVLEVPVSGPERRLDPTALDRVHRAAIQQGLQPIALVATAGTTSCGAIDPLDACADFCESTGLWLHVDAAMGGALLLHPQEKERLHGVHRADSLSLDPHKWIFAPKSAGVLLVRRQQDLVTAHYQAPYLDRFSSHGDALPVSQGRRALDGSRRFDALKVWMILRHLGRTGIAELLDDRLRLTRWFHQRLAQNADFAPCHLPDLNVQAFTPRDPKSVAHVESAHRALEASGGLWTSYTKIDDHPAHRVVLINPSGTQDHLDRSLELLRVAHLSSAQNVALEGRRC
jgi:L-2,4-diaminobutyrate decarboxylase